MTDISGSVDVMKLLHSMKIHDSCSHSISKQRREDSQSSVLAQQTAKVRIIEFPIESSLSLPLAYLYIESIEIAITSFIFAEWSKLYRQQKQQTKY